MGANGLIIVDFQKIYQIYREVQILFLLPRNLSQTKLAGENVSQAHNPYHANRALVGHFDSQQEGLYRWPKWFSSGKKQQIYCLANFLITDYQR